MRDQFPSSRTLSPILFQTSLCLALTIEKQTKADVQVERDCHCNNCPAPAATNAIATATTCTNTKEARSARLENVAGSNVVSIDATMGKGGNYNGNNDDETNKVTTAPKVLALTPTPFVRERIGDADRCAMFAITNDGSTTAARGSHFTAVDADAKPKSFSMSMSGRKW